ncbi:MAG: hypothetical protein R3F11_29100 [Verrucomicrobiales bacterium]
MALPQRAERSLQPRRRLARCFVEDASWLTGPAPIGYGDADDATELTDMQNSYTTVYLRKTFTVPAQSIPDTLIVRAYVDDGCIIWINGTEVARFSVTAGDKAFDATANDHEAGWFEQEVPNASALLLGGTNVIAIHALNQAITSSDFSIDAEVRTPDPLGEGGNPTPGTANSVFSSNVPPNIRQVDHSPSAPLPGEAVAITAKVTDPDGVKAVRLEYQAVQPGSYIRKDDAAYAANWTAVAMNDDGIGGDAEIGDDVFTATLPAALQAHRRLVRYRIVVEDLAGNAVAAPFADDECPNFAYFCYGGVPAWQGAFEPGVSPVETYPPALLESLPTYHLIAEATDVTNSQYNANFDGARMWGTMVYEGKVYDHIRFYNRGEFSTYVSGKNKWRFRFNRARELQARDSWGRQYESTWDTMNLNACASPWAAVNCGMAGIEEAVSFRIFDAFAVCQPEEPRAPFPRDRLCGGIVARQPIRGRPVGATPSSTLTIRSSGSAIAQRQRL